MGIAFSAPKFRSSEVYVVIKTFKEDSFYPFQSLFRQNIRMAECQSAELEIQADQGEYLITHTTVYMSISLCVSVYIYQYIYTYIYSFIHISSYFYTHNLHM